MNGYYKNNPHVFNIFIGRAFQLFLLLLLASSNSHAQVTVTYTYDGLDRLQTVSRSDGPEANFVTDAVGNIASNDITNSPDTDGDLLANFADLDDDNDGMPDAWELQFGFNPLDANDATLDPDGDGRDNITEFIDQTHPLIDDVAGVNVPVMPWLGLGVLAGVLVFIRKRSHSIRLLVVPLLMSAALVTLSVNDVQAQDLAPTVPQAVLQALPSVPVDPGWYQEEGEAVSPEDAQQILGISGNSDFAVELSELDSPFTQASAAYATPSDYSQLAEALENDPLKIYQYVRNHFEYVPYFGALKGAYLTLHERSGNDFDQAALLVELLRAAGYTANFRYGQAVVDTGNAQQLKMLADWLGAAEDAAIIKNILSAGGVPVLLSGSTLYFNRLWVEVTINNSVVSLDPAFKLLASSSGINFDVAMGYNETAILSAAGGTLGTDFIQNINEAGLASYLAARTTQLKNYIQQNHANDLMEDIIGDFAIIPDTSNVLPTSLPLPVNPIGAAWSSISTNLSTTVRLQHGGIDTTLSIPTIAGRKLSIRYTGTTVISEPPVGAVNFGSTAVGANGSSLTWNLINPPANTVVIQLTSTLTGADASAFQFTAGGGTQNIPVNGAVNTSVQLTGVGQTAGRKNAVLNFNYSYNGSSIGSQQVNLTGVVEDRVAEMYLDDALLVSEGAPSGNLTDLMVSVNHPYAASGGTYVDQTVTFELVRDGAYVLASGFGGDRNSTLLAERQRQLGRMSFDGTAPDSPEIYSETLNVIGQTWMQQTQLNEDLQCALSRLRCIRHHRFGIVGQEAGYFVDVKSQRISYPERNTDVGGGLFRDGIFVAAAMERSAMEHSVLEQLQGESNPGISTIKIFVLNNQNGGKLFLANQSNYNSIRPLLSNYSVPQLDIFQTLVNNSSTLVLPENGTVTLNDWSGLGYMDHNPGGVTNSIGMVIGGGLNGGFASLPQTLSPPETYQEFFPEAVPPTNINQNFAGDPVDLNSGAFVSDMTDLALGGTGVRGLAFTRSYNSQQVAQSAAGLGRGWTHSNNIYLSKHSDVQAALGEGTSLQALPLLVAAHVMRGLMDSEQPDIQNWAVSALVANWSTDQLLNKSITVHVGGHASTYRELPDGSFISPAGQTAELVRLGDNTYELRERFGTVLKFNTNDKVSSITDIDGNTLTFTYSGDKLIQVKDTYNRALTFGYAGGGTKLTQVSDSTGRSVTYSHTGDDLTGVTALENANWQYGYDNLHRLLTVIDPMNTTIVDNTYDDFDRVVQQIAPRQTGTAIYKLHYSGFTSAEEAPDGSRLTYHYDVHGRTVAVEDTQGNRSFSNYDGQGHSVKTTDPRGNITARAFDANNNLDGITDANSDSVDLEYDAQHRLISSTNALNHSSETDYDAEHHPTNSRDALNHEVVTTYRADGLVNTVTNARNVVATSTYNSLGQVDTQQIGVQPVVDTNYDTLGRMTSLTDQAGAQTQFMHDDRGLVTTRTDALGEITTYAYNDLGLLTNETDRNGDVSTISYTATSKIEAITFPGHTGNIFAFPASGFTVAFTYDNKDRLTTMVDQHGTTTNNFDTLDRLTSHTDPNGRTVQYAYDEGSNITQLTYPDGKTVSYSYDNLNRISDISIDWLNKNATPSYDAAGRLTGITQFNDTATTYQYDNASRLTGLTHYKGNNQVLADYQYTLDANGNRVQTIITNEPIPPGAMINAVESQTYNTQKNRLVSINNGEQTDVYYDDEGQIEALDNLTGTDAAYAYDAAHRVIAAFRGGQFNSYSYDGAGNRISVSRNSVVTYYVYDTNGNLLAEMASNGTVQKYFIYGLGLMAMVDAQSGELYVYHFDGTGHTVAMTDSNEDITHRYAYSPYGKILAKEETVSQPFTYAGQVGIYTEDIANIYYMRARYYNAELKQFVSPDPAGFVDGTNLYAYVGGNPIGYVDPTGEAGLPGFIGGFAVGFVSGGIGAYAAGGSSFDVVIGAFSGGAVGGIVGAINPGALVVQAGNLARTLTGAVVGAGSNIAGQSAAIGLNPNLDSTDFSPGSVIFNGVLGGVTGTSSAVMGAAAQIGGNAAFDSVRGSIYSGALSPARCGVKCGG